MLPPEGGLGQLRLLSVGPIIQAPGGYPLNIDEVTLNDLDYFEHSLGASLLSAKLSENLTYFAQLQNGLIEPKRHVNGFSLQFVMIGCVKFYGVSHDRSFLQKDLS